VLTLAPAKVESAELVPRPISEIPAAVEKVSFDRKVTTPWTVVAHTGAGAWSSTPDLVTFVCVRR